ncbi:MAG: phage tail protein [Myxococcales bacterium]|nr:phage tail protein [Myxococcales bacterium]
MLMERTKREPFKVLGVAVGIVTDNKDPDGYYRVKVKYPWVSEAGAYTDTKDDADFRSTWCRIATFMAGKDRGAFFLPEVDDEVLLAFEHGDVRRPYVVGSLWNGVDTTIHANEEQKGKNWFRSIRSRSGHMLQFVDKKDDKTERIVIQNLVKAKDEEKDPKQRDGHWICLDQSGSVDQIEIYDHTQEHYILIDTKKKKITIECKTGDMDILVEKTLTIKCKDLKIDASNEIKQKSGAKTSTEAGSDMDIKAGGTMTEKAALIKLN